MEWLEDANGCWIWQLTTNGKGYGVKSVGKKRMGAHRYVYEKLIGPIPEGLDLDHLCRVTSCVNPRHLDPVDRRTNMMRAPSSQAYKNATATHCPRGHEYTPANTLWQRNGKHLSRACRECNNERGRIYRAKKRAEAVERARSFL